MRTSDSECRPQQEATTGCSFSSVMSERQARRSRSFRPHGAIPDSLSSLILSFSVSPSFHFCDSDSLPLSPSPRSPSSSASPHPLAAIVPSPLPAPIVGFSAPCSSTSLRLTRPFFLPSPVPIVHRVAASRCLPSDTKELNPIAALGRAIGRLDTLLTAADSRSGICQPQRSLACVYGELRNRRPPDKQRRPLVTPAFRFRLSPSTALGLPHGTRFDRGAHHVLRDYHAVQKYVTAIVYFPHRIASSLPLALLSAVTIVCSVTAFGLMVQGICALAVVLVCWDRSKRCLGPDCEPPTCAVLVPHTRRSGAHQWL